MSCETKCEMEEGKCESECSSDSCRSECAESVCATECSNESCESRYSTGMMVCYLAKEAKMELIRERVKKKIEATQGKKLDEIADIIVEMMASHMKMKGDMKKQEELKEKLESVFME